MPNTANNLYSVQNYKKAFPIREGFFIEPNFAKRIFFSNFGSVDLFRATDQPLTHNRIT
jgi:hypothetical protein